MALDATVGGPDANSYLTASGATALAGLFPRGDVFAALSAPEQERLLATGTRKIDAYKVWGPRKSNEQRLAFPRGTDPSGEIPDGVINALMDFACAEAGGGGMSALKALQAEGVTSASILGQSMTFGEDRGGIGLPAEAKRELDALWDTAATEIVRTRKYDGSSDPESIYG